MRKSLGDFSSSTVRIIGERVNFNCSICFCSTYAPRYKNKSSNIGEAAHIRGNKKNSKRYVASMSDLDRASVSNGIWLCRNCHKCVDDDDETYTVQKLTQFKERAEELARTNQGFAIRPSSTMWGAIKSWFINRIKKPKINSGMSYLQWVHNRVTFEGNEFTLGGNTVLASYVPASEDPAIQIIEFTPKHKEDFRIDGMFASQVTLAYLEENIPNKGYNKLLGTVRNGEFKGQSQYTSREGRNSEQFLKKFKHIDWPKSFEGNVIECYDIDRGAFPHVIILNINQITPINPEVQVTTAYQQELDEIRQIEFQKTHPTNQAS